MYHDRMPLLAIDPSAVRWLGAEIARWGADTGDAVSLIAAAETLSELSTGATGLLDQIGSLARSSAATLEMAANNAEGFRISVDAAPRSVVPPSAMARFAGLGAAEYNEQLIALMADGASSLDEAIGMLDKRWAAMHLVDAWNVDGDLVPVVAGVITGDIDPSMVDASVLTADVVAALARVEILWTSNGDPLLRSTNGDNRLFQTRLGWTTGAFSPVLGADGDGLTQGDPLNLRAADIKVPWVAQVGVGVASAAIDTVVTAPQWVPQLGRGIGDLLAASVPLSEWREDQADAFVDAVAAGLRQQLGHAAAGDPDAVGAIVFEILASKGAGSISAGGKGRIAAVLDDLALPDELVSPGLVDDLAGGEFIDDVLRTELAPREISLGTEPTGQFRRAEVDTALRVEQMTGVVLERSLVDGVDWIDSTGRTYDAVGSGMPAHVFDQQWGVVQHRIKDHINKADFVPVDVGSLDPVQQQVVKLVVDSLDDPSVFVVGI